MLPGNTIDNQTWRHLIGRIERQYGNARRLWLMDRGIPTEEVLEKIKRSDPAKASLVGTPKGRLNRLEADLANRPWQQAREGVEVKLLTQERETHVRARSRDRIAKERAMRPRQLRHLLNRLKELTAPSMRPCTRDNLLQAIGAAEKEAGKDDRHVTVTVDVKPDAAGAYAARSRLDRQRLRASRRRSLDPKPELHPDPRSIHTGQNSHVRHTQPETIEDVLATVIETGVEVLIR